MTRPEEILLALRGHPGTMPPMLGSLLWLPGALLLLTVLADLLITSLNSGEGRLTRTVHRLLYATAQALARWTGRRTVLI